MKIKYPRMQKGKAVNSFISLTGIFIIICILLMPVYLFIESLPLFRELNPVDLFTGSWEVSDNKYGIKNFLVTSLIIASLATVLSLVISLGLALYMHNYKSRRTGQFLNDIIRFMTGIPTVVYGFAGIVLLIPFMKKYTESPSGLCLATVIIVLSILILPTITIYIHSSFNMVNKKNIMTALSLGASQEQLYLHVIIPSSLRGIAIAAILGFSRAISDTMVPLMLSGNSLHLPKSLFMSGRSLTAHIAMELPGEYNGLEFRIIFFVGLILIALVILFNIIVYYMERLND